MRKRRFTETQIVSILKEADAGKKVKDICRRHGISDATYYNWRSKYGRMSASELKRLKETEAELSQYKKIATRSWLGEKLAPLVQRKDVGYVKGFAGKDIYRRVCRTDVVGYKRTLIMPNNNGDNAR